MIAKSKAALWCASHIQIWSLACVLLTSACGAAIAQDASASNPPQAEKSGAPAGGTPAVVLDDKGVESLLGKDVKSASDEKLGRIIDVLVSHDGELRAVVIDFGGFLGVGTRKVAVAWKTLKFSDRGPILNMTVDELRVTPEYRDGEPVVVVGAAKKSDGEGAPSPQPTQTAP